VYTSWPVNYTSASNAYVNSVTGLLIGAVAGVVAFVNVRLLIASRVMIEEKGCGYFTCMKE
jgi:hypothetical protein